MRIKDALELSVEVLYGSRTERAENSPDFYIRPRRPGRGGVRKTIQHRLFAPVLLS